MIEVFILKNKQTGLVESLSTTRPGIMISDLTSEWYTAQVDINNQHEYASKGLKWAIPIHSIFDGNVFRLISPIIDVSGGDGYSVLVETEFKLLRLKRNSLLTASDWSQLVDAPLAAEKKTEWAVYRQVLRDLPSSLINPYLVIWPDAPA
jgi:hypothetical protein